MKYLKRWKLFEYNTRIQSIMGVISEKLEDIQGTPLYHKTSTNRGINIINMDSLRGVLPSGDYLGYDKRLANTKTQTAISFTRDKNWQPNNTIGVGLDSPLEDTEITFVVDRDKLKTKYKIESFNYHGIDPDSEYNEKFNELEERVMTNEIYPLHKYVIDIIYTGDNPEVQEIIDNYLNRSRIQSMMGLNESFVAGVWSDEDNNYSIDKLVKLVKDRKPTYMSIEKIINKNSDLETKEGNFKDNIENPTKLFKQRTMNANTEYPVMVSEEGWIIDGSHRIAKQKWDNIKKVKVHIITKEDLKKSKITDDKELKKSKKIKY